jgi:hypothetical protein
MTNPITKLAIILIVLVAFVDGMLVAKHFLEDTDPAAATDPVIIQDVFTPKTSESINIYSLQEAPFTTQAIHGWVSPWDQYAEEACIYMAMQWVRGEDITDPSKTADDLLAMGVWENNAISGSGDTPAALTMQILTSYYSHTETHLIDEPTTENLKEELKEGNLIALTINGQLLESPYYGNPAPEHHMLLLIGFDETEQSFIVNDPGTSHGEQIYYSYEKTLASIKDSAIVIQP